MLEQNSFSAKPLNPFALAKQSISLLITSDGKLLSCSNAATQLLQNISKLAFVDSQIINQGSQAWEYSLFKDKATLRRILRQIKKKQHALNINVKVQIAPNQYSAALVFATPLDPKKQGAFTKSQAEILPEILIIIKLTPDNTNVKTFDDTHNKTQIAMLLEYKKNSLWDKIWSIAFNSALTQATTTELLRLVGVFFKAKRVYILNCKTKNLPLSINYEWCAENITALIDKPIIDNNNNLLAPFNFITQHCEPYYIKDTSTLSLELQNTFQEWGLGSLFVIPCSQQAKQKACYCANPELYFIFEPFASAPAWTQEEQDFICELGSFIASAVLYQNNLLKEQGIEHALRMALSFFEASIFLIKEDTGFVQFANRTCQIMFGAKLVGTTCLEGENKDLKFMFITYHRLNEKRILQEHNNSINSTNLSCDKHFQFECFLPECQRWFYIETSSLNSEQYSDSVLFYALDITYKKEEEARLKKLSITDASSGALYLPFGLELLDTTVTKLNKGRSPISLACISLDNYNDLNISNKPNNDNNMMAYIVRIIKMWRTDCQITRLSLNELLITLERVPLMEARAFFEHLPIILQENSTAYSPYELTFSVGYAESNYMLRKNSVTLLMEAQNMCYEAQQLKKNYVYELLL